MQIRDEMLVLHLLDPGQSLALAEMDNIFPGAFSLSLCLVSPACQIHQKIYGNASEWKLLVIYVKGWFCRYFFGLWSIFP